jgi:hypothetical protein
MNEAILTSINPEAQIHDLRDLIGKRPLIELVLAEVQALSNSLVDRDDRLTWLPHANLPLTLLTYCYAAGFYSSEDIEWASRNDSGARYICVNKPVDQETARQFRRTYRVEIEKCLTRVMSVALHSHLAVVATSRPLVSAHQKIEIAIMMDMATAE